MKKLLSLFLCFCLLFTTAAFAEGAPEKPEGTPPAGGPGNGPGGPGGMSGQPDSYTAVYTLSEDTALNGETITSTGTDENALLVTGGSVTLTDSAVTRDSDDSTGGDGTCTLTIDESSTWIVTGDSTLTTLSCQGTIQDDAGHAVTVRDQSGNVLVQGDSDYVITVSSMN